MLVILYVSVNISKQSNLCPSSEQSCCHHPLPAESPLSPDTEKKQIYRRSWVLAGGGRGEDQEVCSAQSPDLGVLCCPRLGLCQEHALLLSSVLEFTFSPANSSLRQVLLISPPWRRGPRSQHRSVVVTWFELQPLCLPVIPC